MSVNGFDGAIALGAGVTRLVTALQAAGYAGRFGFTRANLRNESGATVYFGRRADVDNTTGRPISDGQDHNFLAGSPGTVDFNRMYVYSAAGGTVYFTGETR